MSNSIDLNNPPPNHKFSVSVEREETDGERNVRLFKKCSFGGMGFHEQLFISVSAL